MLNSVSFYGDASSKQWTFALVSLLVHQPLITVRHIMVAKDFKLSTESEDDGQLLGNPLVKCIAVPLTVT